MTFYPELPLEPISNFGPSSQDELIERIHQIYLNDLIKRPLYWKPQGSKIQLRKHPEVNGRSQGFWHLTTGGGDSDETRKVDWERCKRIRWIRVIIENFNAEFPMESNTRWWIDEKRSNHCRYVITRPEFDYFVIVEEREDYALLITAYYAEHNRRRKKLRREHDEYWQKPPTL